MNIPSAPHQSDHMSWSSSSSAHMILSITLRKLQMPTKRNKTRVVNACVCERERERVCVCVCVRACVCARKSVAIRVCFPICSMSLSDATPRLHHLLVGRQIVALIENVNRVRYLVVDCCCCCCRHCVWIEHQRVACGINTTPQWHHTAFATTQRRGRRGIGGGESDGACGHCAVAHSGGRR